MKKLNEKGKYLLSDIGWEKRLEILTGETSKSYKKQNMIQNYPKQWINIHK